MYAFFAVGEKEDEENTGLLEPKEELLSGDEDNEDNEGEDEEVADEVAPEGGVASGPSSCPMNHSNKAGQQLMSQRPQLQWQKKKKQKKDQKNYNTHGMRLLHLMLLPMPTDTASPLVSLTSICIFYCL